MNGRAKTTHYFFEVQGKCVVVFLNGAVKEIWYCESSVLASALAGIVSNNARNNAFDEDRSKRLSKVYGFQITR